MTKVFRRLKKIISKFNKDILDYYLFYNTIIAEETQLYKERAMYLLLICHQKSRCNYLS